MTGTPLLCLSLAVVLWPPRPARIPSLSSTGTGSAGTVFGRPVDRAMWIAAAVPVLGALAWIGGAGVAWAVLVTAGTLTRRLRSSRRRTHRRTEIDSLTVGLDVMIGELRVGGHPATACAVAAQECSGVASAAFLGAASRARLGGSVAEGISVAGSVLEPELDRLRAAWRVADEHGLALADLLAAVREDMLGRTRFRDRTEASLAGAKATAVVLAGLPVLGILLGQMMGADPLRILLGGGLGGFLLAVGTTLACAGLAWTDAITGRVSS